MKIFNYKKHRISKKYLLSASAYRRQLKESLNFMDFSLEALKEQYEIETFGKPKTIRISNKPNGFSAGKRFLDVTLSAMKEDYNERLFVKIEMLEGSCAFVRNFIKNL